MAILLLRVFSFTAACRPAKGTLGGECEDNGCNTYCDEGLQCDNATKTCVAYTPPPAKPSGCNLEPMDAGCSPGQTAYECLGTTTPASERGVPGCAYTSKTSSESALYCCAPTCVALDTSPCDVPSTAYVCSGSATPEETDPSLGCATVAAYWPELAKYCCAPPDSCFGGVSPTPSDCALSETFTVCTGVATPPAEQTCRTSGTDAGTSARGYCCAPPTGDAGDRDSSTPPDAN